MHLELFDQAFRNAVFAAQPAWRPVLWAFLPLLRSHLHFALAEEWLVRRHGSPESDEDPE